MIGAFLGGVITQKLARTLDSTDSARDAKAIARELVAVLDRVEKDKGAERCDDSPLARAKLRTEAERMGIRLAELEPDAATEEES